jgi:hypothetical protein
MEKFNKNFFYLDEQHSSSEEYEDEFPSFSDPKVVGIKTMKQPRRSSACKGPVTLNPYAQAYIGQQHLDPGRFKNKDQQHSDPDQQNKNSWLNTLCCCFKNDSVATEQPVEFTTRTRLQRKPSFKCPK